MRLIYGLSLLPSLPDQPGYSCGVCDFKVWLPVDELDVTVLGLYDDRRFPGRCLLVLKEHAEHLTDLDSQTTARLWEDAKTAARAICGATEASRINYAVLGNAEPHLHVHLVPRVPDSEPLPLRPPWEHPSPQRPLAPERLSMLITSIAAGLPTRTTTAAPNADKASDQH